MKKNSRVYAAIHLDALEQNLENMKKNLTPGTRMIRKLSGISDFAGRSRYSDSDPSL